MWTRIAEPTADCTHIPHSTSERLSPRVVGRSVGREITPYITLTAADTAASFLLSLRSFLPSLFSFSCLSLNVKCIQILCVAPPLPPRGCVNVAEILARSLNPTAKCSVPPLLPAASASSFDTTDHNVIAAAVF